MEQAERLLEFLEETIDYFTRKTEGVDRDRYFADRDIRNILDKTISDIILCVVDICELCLRRAKRTVPETYKDTVLACYEPLGDIALKIAPLVKHRNDTIHQYLKVNWRNIVVVKTRTADIEEFRKQASAFLLADR